jgi:hypothetical protein
MNEDHSESLDESPSERMIATLIRHFLILCEMNGHHATTMDIMAEFGLEDEEAVRLIIKAGGKQIYEAY